MKAAVPRRVSWSEDEEKGKGGARLPLAVRLAGAFGIALAVYALLGGLSMLLFRRISVTVLVFGCLFLPIPLLPLFLLLEKCFLKGEKLLYSLLCLYGIPFLPPLVLLLSHWNSPLVYSTLLLLLGSSAAAYLALALFFLRLFYAFFAWLQKSVRKSADGKSSAAS